MRVTQTTRLTFNRPMPPGPIILCNDGTTWDFNNYEQPVEFDLFQKQNIKIDDVLFSWKWETIIRSGRDIYVFTTCDNPDEPGEQVSFAELIYLYKNFLPKLNEDFLKTVQYQPQADIGKIIFQTEEGLQIGFKEEIKNLSFFNDKSIKQISFSETIWIVLCKDGILWGFRPQNTHNYPVCIDIENQWIQLDFFNDKIINSIHAGDGAVYILCENGVWGYGKDSVPNEDLQPITLATAAETATIPRRIPFLDNKEIIKFIIHRTFVLCWCTCGLYSWASPNFELVACPASYGTGVGQWDVPFATIHRISFFDSKTILDIAVLHKNWVLVLTEEGVFHWGFEENSTHEPKLSPVKIDVFSVPDRIPLIFSHYFEKSLLKSARK